MAKIPATPMFTSEPLASAEAMMRRASRDAARGIVEKRQLRAMALRQQADTLAKEAADLYIEKMFLERFDNVFRVFKDLDGRRTKTSEELEAKLYELQLVIDEANEETGAVGAFQPFVDKFNWG